MDTLNETEKAEYLIDLSIKMEEFIEQLPESHRIGFLPDHVTQLMAKAALTVLETVKDTNSYFEEQVNAS